jgi:hypothetical protein
MGKGPPLPRRRTLAWVKAPRATIHAQMPVLVVDGVEEIAQLQRRAF